LLERDDSIQGADRGRGRFRAYLLGSLKHFVANQRTRRRARKRGGDRIHFSLNYEAAEASYQYEPADTQTPENIFRRRWALSVLERVVRRLQSECASKGNAALFESLKDCLTGASDRSHAELAAALSITTGAVKTAAHRLRRRYRELLRDEIAQTVTSEDEVLGEIRDLLDALSGE